LPTSHSLLSRFPRYSVVAGEVIRVTGSKAVVALGDNVQGHIPARELTWTDVDNPRRFVREGQHIETMVMGEDDVLGVLILSRRLMLRNPWPTIAEAYPAGSTHTGRVSQVKAYGAFVELEPGVDGLVHTDEIPRQDDTEQLIELWPNDRVRVRVLAADPARHRLVLSIRAVVEERDQRLVQRRHGSAQGGTTIGEALGIRPDPLANVELPWYDPAGQVQSILLVDDDEEFIRQTAEWLRLLGYQTTSALTFQAGRELIERERPSLLLVDYELDEGNGLDLAAHAAEHLPNARVVLLSGQADRQLCQWRERKLGIMCWSKPFAMHDFAELLRMIETEGCMICQHEPDHKSISVDLFRHERSPRPSLAPLETICGDELHQLIATTGAHAGFICLVESGHQQVRIIAQEGADLTISASAQPDLIHSPINDICLHGKAVQAADMADQPGLFRYLLPLGPFKSILGVPVRQADNGRRPGILLFHRNADHFTAQHMGHARISAGFLGLQIERRHMLRMSLAAQQTILAGRLSLMTAHEIQKQLGTIGAQVETLNVRLHKLRRQEDIFDYQTLLDLGLPESGARLQKSVQNVGGVLRRQLDFARAYTVHAFDVNALVERTLQMLRPVASAHRIYLAHQLTRTIPPIYSAELLVLQILLNLAFNAIEQMHAARIFQGELLISTAYVEHSPRPLRVRFSDCGPGVHAAHHDQLFELGFTTRPAGTGQGLYISRATAEALGGELIVLETWVGFGSVFELALPLRAEEPAHE
jgi:signal transduction histidine kinase/predicted RNA-binding protein with RPS1 domain/CheY-like chemotaxis protein